ncbi:hypothetical protein AAVH_19625 [Aphelenchoides avenae]|nr:hypothetical protein AAVH_19625 [Aphelenchus avenae]
MQLVCRFLLEFILNREAKELPLRSISRVYIGRHFRPKPGDYWEQHWLPVVNVVRDSSTGAKRPETVHQLVPYLRLAYCESICIDLRWTRFVRHGHHNAAYGAFFGDLLVPNTFVDVLTVRVDEGGAILAPRAFEAFKPLNKVVVKATGHHDWENSFYEAFFLSAAECGVRSIEFKSDSRFTTGIGLLPALSFGFSELAAGGDRSITGVDCDIDDDNFLEQLVKLTSELDGRQRIDFKFSIGTLSKAIDRAGFERYQKDLCSWLVNDLKNGVMLEVVEHEESVRIHVFSSA